MLCGGHGSLRLLRTDRVGRVLFERRSDTRVIVFAACGCASTQIGAIDEGPTRVVLQAMSPVAGTVTNADGSAASGARVQMMLTAGDGTEYPQANATHTNLLPIAISGDNGRFELLLPPFNARVSLQVTGRDPKESAMAMIDWDPKAPKPIAITLGKQ